MQTRINADLDRHLFLLDNISMQNKRYIKIEHNHALCTNDGWATFSYIEDASKVGLDYCLENNSATIYEIRLKHSFGFKVAQVILEEYKKIGDEWFRIKKKHLDKNDGYGSYFEIFAIAVLHNVSYEKVIKDYLVCGSEDGKVDAIVFGDNDVIVYQIKIGNLEEDNIDVLMKENIEEYMLSHRISKEKTSDLTKYLTDHFDKDIFGKNIYYKTISTNGQKSNNINSNEVYGRFISNEVERNKISFKNRVEIPTNKKHQTVIYNPNSKHKEIFVFANADSLVKTLTNYIENDDNIDYLFVDNVRGRLKKNNVLIQTIKNDPEMFCFYNNGISIVGNFNCQENLPIVTIENPIIINGQQTMMSLFAARDEKIDISNVFVPLFLKEVETDEELRNIAKYNNSQAKIQSLDLLSIDKNLRRIQSELLDNCLEDLKNNKPCFYLDIVRNGKNRHKERAKKLFDKDCIIFVSDFVKLYSVVNNIEDLGLWKNNVDGNIKKKYKNGFDYIEKEKALSICNAIRTAKHFIGNNNEYRIADLTIQFLFYFGYAPQEIESIINFINDKSNAKNENKANAFRTNKTIKELRDAVESLHLENKFDIEKK